MISLLRYDGVWGYKGRWQHMHIGWWAGDKDASPKFRKYLKEKYINDIMLLIYHLLHCHHVKERILQTGMCMRWMIGVSVGQFGPESILSPVIFISHKTDDDKRTYILPKDSLSVPPYDIPLRALMAKDGDNLMMAGRCLSADQLALSSARVMPQCSMMGEAVGITAALAVKRKKAIHDIPANDVRELMIQGGAVFDKNKVPRITNMP